MCERENENGNGICCYFIAALLCFIWSRLLLLSIDSDADFWCIFSVVCSKEPFGVWGQALLVLLSQRLAIWTCWTHSCIVVIATEALFTYLYIICICFPLALITTVSMHLRILLCLCLKLLLTPPVIISGHATARTSAFRLSCYFLHCLLELFAFLEEETKKLTVWCLTCYLFHLSLHTTKDWLIMSFLIHLCPFPFISIHEYINKNCIKGNTFCFYIPLPPLATFLPVFPPCKTRENI